MVKANKLRLSGKKTTYIIFRPINKPISKISVTFEGNCITHVREQKFLGVWFQEELNWNTHVNHLITALARIVNCFHKTVHLIPLRLKLNMYYALFHSKVTYGILVWGTTSQRNYHRLITVQKKILRCFENYRGKLQDLPTAPLFIKHSMLRVDQLYYFKFLQVIQQNKLYEQGGIEKPYYCLREQRIRAPKVRTNYGKQSAAYQTHHVLNIIVYRLNFKASSAAFKKQANNLIITTCIQFQH